MCGASLGRGTSRRLDADGAEVVEKKKKEEERGGGRAGGRRQPLPSRIALRRSRCMTVL